MGQHYCPQQQSVLPCSKRKSTLKGAYHRLKHRKWEVKGLRSRKLFPQGPGRGTSWLRPWPAHNPKQGCSLEEVDTSCHCCPMMLFDLDAQLIPLLTKQPSDLACLQEGRKTCVSGPSDSCSLHGQFIHWQSALHIRLDAELRPRP